MAKLQEAESRFIEIAGRRVHYMDLGQGPATIMLHGAGPGAAGWSNFSRNATPLAQRRRIIVPDLPGFGQSAPWQSAGGLFGDMGRFLIAFIEALGLEKASLVGNSLGGATALRAALEAPGKVDRLVLMGAAGGLPVTTPFPTEGLMRLIGFYEGEGPTEAKMTAWLQSLVFDRSHLTPELVRERLEGATRPDIVANPPLRGRAPHPEDEIWRADLGKLPHEALIVWGREDRVIPLDAGLVYARLIRNARLHVFPQCGHWAQWEKADEFNALVDAFLPANT